jgi:hypothetical protein
MSVNVELANFVDQKVDQAKETEHLDFKQFGEMLGVPITVRPWWGSARRRGYSECAKHHRRVSPDGYCFDCRRRLRRDEMIVHHVTPTWECPMSSSSSFRRTYTAPEVQRGRIILWEGPCGVHGHSHSQWIRVRDVLGKVILIAIHVGGSSKGGVFEGCSYYSTWLIGVDGRAPFVVPVLRRHMRVREAFDWLMPNRVKQAIAAGKDVKRQGDWYFIPFDSEPRTDYHWSTELWGHSPLKLHVLYENVNLIYGDETRHRAEQVVYGSPPGTPNGYAPIVKGRVTAPDHDDLFLETWHLAIRNKCSTGGRRASGQGMDD